MSNNNPINLPFSLIDGDAFPWEITADGELEYGRIAANSDTGEQYFQSYGGLYNNFYSYHSADAYTEDNGREVVVAPRYLGNGYGGDSEISLSRKVYVSENSGFVRILDIVKNTYSEPWQYDHRVYNNSYNLPSNITKTSSGNSKLNLDDNWLVLDSISDNNTSDIVRVIAGTGGYRPYQVSNGNSSDVIYRLQLAPGETQIVMHFIARTSDVATALAKGDQLALLGMNALAGMTEEEKRQVINFSTGFNNKLPPDLIVESAQILLGEVPISDGNISVTLNVKNQGSGALLEDISRGTVYISDDNKLDENDRAIYSWSQYLENSMMPNTSYEITESINLSQIKPGHKFLIFEVDGFYGNTSYHYYNEEIESNESNNVLAIPIEVKAPDLDIIEANIENGQPPSEVSWGQKISVSWSVKNQSNNIPAPDNWSDRIYISSDPYFDKQDLSFDIDVEYIDRHTPLAPGATYKIQKNITIPGGSEKYLGSKYLVFVADDFDNQGETDEGNNVYVYPIPIEFKAPDLTITTNPDVSLPPTAIPGQQIPVSWIVTNQGNGAAIANWYDYVYLSNNTTFESWQDTPLTSIAVRTPLATGASYTSEDKVITIPTTAKGPQYLLFVADGYDSWNDILRLHTTSIHFWDLLSPSRIPFIRCTVSQWLCGR
ncbi:hypothetical protein WA1_03905 [Scytonema hofmannii PCC 7110]|uniref:CARDB domain-containing protein n=1 Tax=Scytonema hofmannii PCC 7110 TaxID=128403 RepID=A0A139X4K1_9CYAN|nr:CARDB domain-containing protein [Scytonema hofmannii]KYC39583.1 hypothetical protein WA1_03905 [Scytonema hofmannii PCC 7110]